MNASSSVLFFELVSQGKTLTNANFSFFLNYIKDGRIKNKVQISELLQFLKDNPDFNYENTQFLDEQIGVGLDYSEDDIKKYVEDFI